MRIEIVSDFELVLFRQRFEIVLQRSPDRDDLFYIAVEVRAVVGSVLDYKGLISGVLLAFDD